MVRLGRRSEISLSPTPLRFKMGRTGSRLQSESKYTSRTTPHIIHHSLNHRGWPAQPSHDVLLDRRDRKVSSRSRAEPNGEIAGEGRGLAKISAYSHMAARTMPTSRAVSHATVALGVRPRWSVSVATAMVAAHPRTRASPGPGTAVTTRKWLAAFAMPGSRP